MDQRFSESSTSLRTPPPEALVIPTPSPDPGVAPTLATDHHPPVRVARHLGIGSWVGPYRIESLLAEGGMGMVYRARSVIPVREVALKVIRVGLVSPRLMKRFELEAEVLRRLDHPGIARIIGAGSFDAGSGGGPQPYFAMELVPGRPLTQYANEQRLSVLERVALMAKICDAVQHAHAKGVIHRDLKPGNVLVVEVADAGSSPFGDQPAGGDAAWCAQAVQPKVLDFGVARLVDDSGDTSTRTLAGQMVGTLPYMSPEQVGGDPHDVDTRSDVYALGVTLYELITGNLPYDVLGVGVLEAARIIREQPPRPIPPLPRKLHASVAAIIAKALHKDRSRRYQSAAGLAADLRRVLADEPVGARALSASDLIRTFARRHRAWALGAAAATLSLLVGLVFSTFMLGEARGERDRTRAELIRATRDARHQTAATLLRQARALAGENRRAEAMTTLAACELVIERMPLDDANLRQELDSLRRELGLTSPDQP
jgi:eukaryotic-like serine/threonine-protein kinase